MQDAYHNPLVVQTAVDLANTLMPIKGEDRLETVEQLRAFLDDHPAAEPPSSAAKQGVGPRHLTRADLAEVRALRGTVREVLERANADAVEAAALINDGLRRSRATPVLRHEDDRWWTEVTSDTDRRSAHLAATTLSALASVIATLGPARLGVCAGPTCRATFVDLSRNGSKQYCTRPCAHRASVAAYRSRRSPR
ncbi:CGNR zinc finger domain-containing protein [Streptomyces sp. NPDC050610]|uniref:CGNR zinc finger domain-containing protein n=1 Tax=Streptomyces sp. NPDC050610 TaxID=3157097 RepID=UPI003428B92C